jgi:hypothetical protein
MTPDEFRQRVLPLVLAAWEKKCLCHSAGFRKLLSFNFQDYGNGPVGLVDSEAIGHEIVRSRFKKLGEPSEGSPGEWTQRFECPQCGARCRETCEDFSIHMWRSFYRFEDTAARADVGYFLVGFYAFRREDFERVHDFQPAISEVQFLSSIGVT